MSSDDQLVGWWLGDQGPRGEGPGDVSSSSGGLVCGHVRQLDTEGLRERRMNVQPQSVFERGQRVRIQAAGVLGFAPVRFALLTESPSAARTGLWPLPPRPSPRVRRPAEHLGNRPDALGPAPRPRTGCGATRPAGQPVAQPLRPHGPSDLRRWCPKGWPATAETRVVAVGAGGEVSWRLVVGEGSYARR